MFEMIKTFFIPSNLILILSLGGIILLLSGKKKRFAIGLISAALILYLFWGTGFISLWFLGNLENRYPSLKAVDGLRDMNEIVVLSGYAETDPALSPSSEVNVASAFRLLETRRIFNFLPGANVLITGGGDVPTIMGNLLVSLGVPQSRITIEDQSSNTFENAVQVQKLLKDKKFILVTSAGHMPRAMGVFKKLGMNPIPAPTNFMSIKKCQFSHLLPSPLHLSYSDLAVHEYMGIAWYRLTGRL
jgi:uncharacterized SAM-binding protein YcdF (DUF218 family)